MLQEIPGQGRFFPADLEGWLSVLAWIGAAASVAAGMVWQGIKRHTNTKIEKECTDRKTADANIDARVFDHATKLQTLMGKAEVWERFQERSEMDRASIHTNLGRVEGEVTQLTKMMAAAELERVKEMSALREEVRTGFAVIRTMLNEDKGRSTNG